MSISEAVRDWLIQPILDHIDQKEKKTMAKLDDLTQKLSDAVTKLGTDIQTEFDILKAQIAAGGVTQVQLDAIQAQIDKLTGLDTSVLAEATPPAPPAA